MRASQQLRADAMRIWRAGVAAVDSGRLVREAMRVEGGTLLVGDESIDLDAVQRIAVVGTGKAGAGMAAAVEQVLGPELMQAKKLAGWVNVPDDCVRPLEHIWLHGARPAGVNEPTAAGAIGAGEIVQMLESLGQDDLCLCLISGGGSALLPAPVEQITLQDKLAVTQWLSAAGANIEQLNTVRKQLSRLKGGGLARACRAGRLVTLIISDVPGDPLDMIASGPTVSDRSTPDEALAVLSKFDTKNGGASTSSIPPAVLDFLHRKKHVEPREPKCRVTNLIIGNNATAVDAAGMEAERLGYRHAMHSAPEPEGPAEHVGQHLAEMALSMRGGSGPNCLISGGEPTVRLVERSRRGRGGRNQQLVLAALTQLAADGANGIAILSGGTDGEDGPTDAAGAVLDAKILEDSIRRALDPADYLARNDAYHFFEPLGALIKTGPTHTNVCDLRVVVVDAPGE
ncbi:MAG: DUF4147 domain-containing protein [Pirellulales bacterium]|nr:DUF4147 domain-containing protein [Pirellulales bacterium]